MSSVHTVEKNGEKVTVWLSSLGKKSRPLLFLLNKAGQSIS
jgi:hypothetical protein